MLSVSPVRTSVKALSFREVFAPLWNKREFNLFDNSHNRGLFKPSLAQV